MSADLSHVLLQVAALQNDDTPLNLRVASTSQFQQQQADSAGNQGREDLPKRPRWMAWGAPPTTPKGTPPNLQPQAEPVEEGQSRRAEDGLPDPKSPFGSRAKRPADEAFLETESSKTKQEVPRDGIFQRWLERFGV